jgi:hypothetical protein
VQLTALWHEDRMSARDFGAVFTICHLATAVQALLQAPALRMLLAGVPLAAGPAPDAAAPPSAQLCVAAAAFVRHCLSEGLAAAVATAGGGPGLARELLAFVGVRVRVLERRAALLLHLAALPPMGASLPAGPVDALAALGAPSVEQLLGPASQPMQGLVDKWFSDLRCVAVVQDGKTRG